MMLRLADARASACLALSALSHVSAALDEGDIRRARALVERIVEPQLRTARDWLMASEDDEDRKVTA